ncbi:MAG: hypothetical protein K0Q69_3681, partial [Devosia sp.]|nr:hypothetical protein [Devosia sp.]
AARAHALGFTWSRCADLFLEALVPVREAAAKAA